MPKRKHDGEEDDEATGTLETGDVDGGDVSDGEEDGDSETEKYVLQDEDIEGQEEQTVRADGDIQITPFNMQEEMEEGHFDKEGNYIPEKRDKDEIKDHWLDNIDWVKVTDRTAPAGASNADDAEEESAEFDELATYEKVLAMLQPGETVLRALKRFGGKTGASASERWKKKKEQAGTGGDPSDKQKLLELTGLADTILNRSGNMDVYQETYEGIRYKLERARSAKKEVKDELDMFGEDFDEKMDQPAAKKVKFEEKEKEAETAASSQVQWQFKWENSDSAEVHGPHSTEEMQHWVDQGYFEPNGVWVRRVGQTGEFHSSRRIDFDIYL